MKIEDYKSELGGAGGGGFANLPHIESFDELEDMDIQVGDNVVMDGYDWVCETNNEYWMTLVHSFTADASPSRRLVYQYRLEDTD